MLTMIEINEINEEINEAKKYAEKIKILSYYFHDLALDRVTSKTLEVAEFHIRRKDGVTDYMFDLTKEEADGILQVELKNYKTIREYLLNRFNVEIPENAEDMETDD